MAVSKRSPLFIVMVILTVVLIGGGGTALLGTRMESDRIRGEIDKLNGVTSDLTNLGELSNISAKGWISGSSGSQQILGILGRLREFKCCVLEGDLAIPALQSLDHFQVTLADEKTRIAGKTFINDAVKALQTEMVKAYATNEQLARDVSQLVVQWPEIFSEDKREARIKAMEDATETGLVAYTDVQEKIDHQIIQTRSELEAVPGQLSVLKNSQNDMITRTNLAILAIGIGVVLLVVLVILLLRSRTSAQLVSTEQAQQKSLRNRKRG